MPVSAVRPGSVWVGALAVLPALAHATEASEGRQGGDSGVAASSPDLVGERRNAIRLDVYAFGQGDDQGGNAFRDEAFRYGAISLDVKLAVSENAAVVMNGVLAYIENSFENPLPEVWSGQVTSATPNILTLDSSVGVEWKPKGSSWTLVPSFFYHHQDGFVSVGPNMDVSTDVAGGDASLFSSLNLRFSWPWWANFDNIDFEGVDSDYDRDARPVQYSTSLLMGWQQNWSPSLRTVASVQLARQDGRLHNTLQYVTALDPTQVFSGDPRTAPIQTLVQDNLPNQRNRLQGNLRLRWSPALGTALGLDLSGYVDDWGIEQGALQPTLEFPLGPVRITTWYRFQAQTATKFWLAPEDVLRRYSADDLVANPRTGRKIDDTTRFRDGVYATQDSDLAALQTHSPGLLVHFPLLSATRIQWDGRVSGFGWVRNDGLFLGGVNMGVVSAW